MNLVIGAQMITVLLVDDHASVRNSLRYLLEATDDIKVVAAASTGAEAVAQSTLLCPDVAVVDISMPEMDGIETARQIHANCRSTRVMMLSIYGNSEYVQRALDVGALGFVLKNVIGEDLLAAIRALSKGQRYFSKTVSEFAQKYINQTGEDSWAG
jgi:DNA-binding NarL/FixJ family response regulator